MRSIYFMLTILVAVVNINIIFVLTVAMATASPLSITDLVTYGAFALGSMIFVAMAKKHV